MAVERCPQPRKDCPFYNRRPPRRLSNQEHGCYSDPDHIIPQRELKTTLERLFGNLALNIEQRCRWEHEIRNAKHEQGEVDWPELPSREEMLGAVLLAVANEELYLSARNARRVMNG